MVLHLVMLCLQIAILVVLVTDYCYYSVMKASPGETFHMNANLISMLQVTDEVLQLFMLYVLHQLQRA